MAVYTYLLQQMRRILFPPAPDTKLSLSALAATVTHTTCTHGGSSIIAPLPYEHALVRHAVAALKFKGDMHAARLLAATLAPILAEELADKRLTGAFEQPVLIPMPLHILRLRERGFNQCERIAAALIKNLGETPPLLNNTVLVRTKHTPQQSRIRGATARRANVRDAFFVTVPDRVVNRDILLLDDVVTTGATMHSARTALERAGARNVLCIAAARA